MPPEGVVAGTDLLDFQKKKEEGEPGAPGGVHWARIIYEAIFI